MTGTHKPQSEATGALPSHTPQRRLKLVETTVLVHWAGSSIFVEEGLGEPMSFLSPGVLIFPLPLASVQQVVLLESLLPIWYTM